MALHGFIKTVNMTKQPQITEEGDLKLYSTQIPNVLLDRLMPVIAPALWKIVCCVARQTYGWQKKWDAISLTQATKKTGLSKRCVIDSFAVLVKAGVLVLGEVGRYGQEYRLNSSCDMDKACEILEPQERQPRRKTGGTKKNSEVNPDHQPPSEPISPLLVNQVPVATEPSSPPEVNPDHPQKKLSKSNIKTNYQKGEQSRPPSPVILIAREKLSEHIKRTGPNPRDPDYDRQMFHCILAGRGGLTPTQVKDFLAEDPEWRKWPYLAVLDSQQEIEFPDPPKPQPQSAPEPEPPWWEHRLSPERYEKARNKALEYLAIKAANQSTEQVWRELGTILGTLSVNAIDDFIESIQQLEQSA